MVCNVSMRLAQVSLCAGIFTAAAGPANAAPVGFDLTFSGSGLPLWGSSDPDPVFAPVLAEVPLGPSIGPDAVVDVPVFGEFGFAANFSAGINIGLETAVRDFHVGSTDLTYPVDVNLNIPDTIVAGEAFTISSGFSVKPGAGFTAVADQGLLDIGAQTGLFADLTLKACAFGCFIDEKPLDVNEPLGTLPLIRQTQTATEFQIDIPGFGKPTIAGPGVDIDPDNTDDSRSVTDPDFLLDFAIAEATNVSGLIRAPKVEVTGALSGTRLTGSKTDFFTDVDVNLTGFLPGSTVANFGPIDLGNGLQFGYDLFSGVLGTQLFGRQDLEFEAVPEITLDLGGLGAHTFLAGDSITLTAPDDIGTLEIQPSFSLLNTFTNNLVLAATQDFTVTVGELFLKMPEIVIVPPTDPVIVDPPAFCLIPNPFGGCIKRVNPRPFTLVPGTPGVTIDEFLFDERIFQQTFTDQLVQDLAGIDVATCDVTSACDTLPLFGSEGAKAASLFSSQQSFGFDRFAGSALQVGVVAGTGVAIPVPGTAVLLLVALGLCSLLGLAGRRRHIAWRPSPAEL